MLSISDDVQREYPLSYKNNIERKKQLIFEEYYIQRKMVRNKLFDGGEDGNRLIDIHKISACFTAAVLQ